MQLFHYQKAYLYKSFACIDKNTSLGTQFPSCYTGFIRAIDSNSQIALHDSIFNCKADIRNPLSLLAHERSRFATCSFKPVNDIKTGGFTMKVLGIVAGRHNGNSEILVKEALLACQESWC